MQAKFSTAIVYSVFLTLILVLLVPGCQKNNSQNEEPLSVATNATTVNEKTSTPANPNFNLEVILRGEGNQFENVKFRQNNDASKIVTLGVWVRDLEPDHLYLLQRAVDTNLDGNCRGTPLAHIRRGPAATGNYNGRN